MGVNLNLRILLICEWNWALPREAFWQVLLSSPSVGRRCWRDRVEDFAGEEALGLSIDEGGQCVYPFTCKWLRAQRGATPGRLYRATRWNAFEKKNISWIMTMHVITRKRLNDFAEAHPESRSALQRWYHLLKSRNFDSFAELREIFPEADQVGRLTVFNVGDNKVRLIAAIHYNRRKVYIRAVLTHEEYGKSKWKE